MKTILKLALTAGALVAANYFYQFFNAHNWAEATDRSFFQIVAIAIVGWNMMRGTYGQASVISINRRII